MHAHNPNAPESSSEASSTGRERFIRTKRKFRPAGYVVAGSNSKSKAPELESSSSGGSSNNNWKVVTESELESLLARSIEESFRLAVKKLVAMGYNPGEVSEAIIGCGYKAFPGIVDCAVLNCVKHADNRSNTHVGVVDESMSSGSASLDVKVVLNEMVNAVRDDRPSLSRADAMWCLLMSELDVKEAFRVETSEAQLSPSSAFKARVSKPEAQASSTTLETSVSQASSPPASERSSSEHPLSTREAEERIRQLSEEVRGLRTEVEERTEWARSKVLQAAQRLSKDVSELRKLRAEKEQASRAEESSLKRFSDLENALRKTGTQLDQTRSALQKLEMSNAEIRAELEAAKLSAAESVASCMQASKIEKKSQKKAQTWEKQRSKLQEELAAERKKVAEAHQQLVQSKEKQLQAEVRSRQELKAREEAISRMEAEKLAREQAESSARRRVEMIQSKSESDLRFHREEIQKLEQEITRLKSGGYHDSTPAAPFSLWASTGFITPVLEASSPAPARAPSPAPAEWPEFNILRDRECVMCLCNERSVVFLPCAHQVVCVKCNELHQSEGMSECPSCRTRIQQRIQVYGATS